MLMSCEHIVLTLQYGGHRGCAIGAAARARLGMWLCQHHLHSGWAPAVRISPGGLPCCAQQGWQAGAAHSRSHAQIV